MKILILLLAGFLTSTTSFSQVGKQTAVSVQVDHAIRLYDDFTDGNAPIYNGPEYLFFTFRMEGNPFFNYESLSKEKISYAGKTYFPISILYDINRNQLVLLRPDSSTRIVLHNEYVDSFTISGHHFIRLSADHAQNLYQTGFYDLLYNGKMQLLARRIKLMSSSPGDRQIIQEFYEKDRYYLHKQGIYYQVDNQKEVFKLFADSKHEIKKMLRNQHLRFRHKDFETTLLKVTEFVDQLTHPHE